MKFMNHSDITRMIFSKIKSINFLLNRVFEDHLSEKIIILEKNLDKSYEDLNRIKEKFNETNEKRKIDYDEIVRIYLRR